MRFGRTRIANRGNIRCRIHKSGCHGVYADSGIETQRSEARWTKRSDIAETVVFLASEGAAGITGQVIAVTGWGL